jgi:BirA family biotin operon repressor/biotin-[acetyl-CoA-carboxylase] ligase
MHSLRTRKIPDRNSTLKIYQFDELSSSNDYALEFLKKCERVEDTLVLADRQSAGRGRLNERSWASVSGNFHGSYIINIKCVKTQNITLLNYITLLSIKDILNNIAEKSNIKKEIIIKNPNDILVNEKKISGVLIEISYPYAVVGIGINLKMSPIERSTDILKEFKYLVSPIELGENLYKRLISRISDIES